MDDHPLKKSKKPPPPPIPAPSDSDSPPPAEASHQNFTQTLSTRVAAQNVDTVLVVVSSLGEEIRQTSRQPERAAKEREGDQREKREEAQRK